MKEIKIISLGGSLIIPDNINLEVLKKFKEVILKNTDKYKFVVVCGGGRTARNYINGLENVRIPSKIDFQCQLGITATRLNARFMNYFFGKETKYGIPHSMKDVKNLLHVNDIVFCGALRQGEKETSDSTSARLARFFQTDFINLTNVEGLFNKNPFDFKDAKFIPEISHNEFYKMANKKRFIPGQHFVLDQNAAKIIKKYNIITYILGPDMTNLDKLLNNEHFSGTIISR